jgi:hypothetical protein
MDFLRKSLVFKLIFKLCLFALLIGAVVFFLSYREMSMVPYEAYVISLVVLLMFFAGVYFVDAIKPMKALIFEMQALIAGKRYKQVMTKRIDEIGIIAHFFNQVTKGLGKVSGDIADNKRMLSELDVAAQLQRDILPLESPEIKGLQVVVKNKPASELGGDSFNFIRRGNKVYFYIGDVTGHGVAAGLIMTMVNSLIEVFTDLYDDIYQVLVAVNKFIKKHVKKAMFMTAVMLCWDEETGKLSYAGAGHEHILVYRADSGQCEVIMSGGVALGMIPDNSKVIKKTDLPLADGDFVVLYSDGITEARNKSKEQYGIERLKTAIMEYAPQYTAEGVNHHIAKAVVAFSGGAVQEDDMTLIVIKCDSSISAEEQVRDKTTSWTA